MSLQINTADVLDVSRYVIKSPNPADSVDAILKKLSEIESQIDSEQVDGQMDELVTTAKIFGSNTKRKCFNIKLRTTETKELKKFGCVIYPVVFGNLVYLTKYEYLSSWFGWTSSGERDAKIRQKLDSIDKYNEYIFIQTLGDYVFCEMIREFDKDHEANLKLYANFMSVGRG
tara:strand:- start:67 stop:585 length:519 start_codon:yes stop_codon:yes gene_type:complete